VSRSIRNTKIDHRQHRDGSEETARDKGEHERRARLPLGTHSPLLMFQKNGAGPWTTPETVLRYAIG
jgi:hypothetical protein